jgi:hypothetical protein
MEEPEINEFRKKAKDRALANMKFIGNLYLRSLLAAKVIGGVLHDLLISAENIPEQQVECACELLQNVGCALESTHQGEALMQKFSARLLHLKLAFRSNGKAALSRRVQFQIQDLFDLKNNGWTKKMFRETAKKKEDIRQDAVQQAKRGEVGFATQTAGMRPAASEAPEGIPGMRPTTLRDMQKIKDVLWLASHVGQFPCSSACTRVGASTCRVGRARVARVDYGAVFGM